MTHSLYLPTILVLNRQWNAIGVTAPAHVFGAMSQDTIVGLEIQSPDWMLPATWEDWKQLPIREGDRAIGTVAGRIRIPTVVVATSFDRLPRKRLKFSFRGLWERDGGRCQYTGRKLTFAEANIDHVIPRSRGGPTTWENCVLSDKDINQFKADRTPNEAGLTLLKEPALPPRRPVTEFIQNKHDIKDWQIFLPAS